MNYTDLSYQLDKCATETTSSRSAVIMKRYSTISLLSESNSDVRKICIDWESSRRQRRRLEIMESKCWWNLSKTLRKSLKRNSRDLDMCLYCRLILKLNKTSCRIYYPETDVDITYVQRSRESVSWVEFWRRVDVRYRLFIHVWGRNVNHHSSWLRRIQDSILC